MSEALKEAVYRAALEQLKWDQDDRELRAACVAFADGLVALEALTAPGRATMRHAAKETKH